MPRTARVIVENACYHIITRGNRRQTVFDSFQDYEKYLFLLARYKKRYKFKLYCFCLMPNHVHLIMEVQNPFKLHKVMHGLNLSYTIYFNSKYRKVGHLWQDRFISKAIEKGEYLLECINYIENNPVRASLASRANEYQWSSNRLRISDNQFLDNLFAL